MVSLKKAECSKWPTNENLTQKNQSLIFQGPLLPCLSEGNLNPLFSMWCFPGPQPLIVLASPASSPTFPCSRRLLLTHTSPHSSPYASLSTRFSPCRADHPMLGALHACCVHPKPAESHVLPTISTSINITRPQLQEKFSSKADELEPKSSKDACTMRLRLLTTNLCTLSLAAEQMGLMKPHQHPTGRKEMAFSFALTSW